MTDNEIRIEIAERCGWTRDEKGFWFKPGKPHSWNYDSLGPQDREGCFPNYPNDLNAIHEIATNNNLIFDCDLWNKSLFIAVFGKDDPQEVDRLSDAELTYHLNNATARQRAEAFLRTVGAWKD